ncbi:phage tail protein [Pseudomonas sp. JDS08PS003]|uniref:phage tail protein n=1 Tax=Pseudomonas sp. JDS08PS003 TaxID=2497162 RepID=UPI003857D515
MIDSNSQFFAILTAVGEAKQANATALGTPWTFKEMAVGDANSTDPIPNKAQTKLINEWRRAPVNQVRTDPANPNIIITEQVIPPDVGGRWIREIGLFDADGDLVALANCAPSFKPLLVQGTGKTQVIRMNFIVTSTAQIVLKIDPAVVLATREYVDNAVVRSLPKDKKPGEFTRLKVNNQGIVVSGDNPSTLAGMGIKDTYTKAEIESMLAQASSLPVGSMVAFPQTSVPSGFLEIDGSVQRIAVYPDLAAYLGTAFNKGDEGAGNFRLPESRGEFLRGWDHGRGVDAGRALGSNQGQSTEGHYHVTGVNDTASSTIVQAARGADFWPFGVSAIGVPSCNTVTSAVFTPSGEDSWLNTGPNVSSGSGDTRPRNLAVMWCIKAWSAPVNQGNIDVAVLAPLAAHATENNQGTAKVGTQTQVNAGTDDSVMVTPKKLRWGFSISFAQNGGVFLPFWLGGLVIQWGVIITTGGRTGPFGNFAFPFAFPTSVLSIIGSSAANNANSGLDLAASGIPIVAFDSVSTTGARWRTDSNNGTNMANGIPVRWLAFGY